MNAIEHHAIERKTFVLLSIDDPNPMLITHRPDQSDGPIMIHRVWREAIVTTFVI